MPWQRFEESVIEVRRVAHSAKGVDPGISKNNGPPPPTAENRTNEDHEDHCDQQLVHGLIDQNHRQCQEADR